MKEKDFRKLMKELGYDLARQRGSHMTYKNGNLTLLVAWKKGLQRKVVLQNHNREVRRQQLQEV